MENVEVLCAGSLSAHRPPLCPALHEVHLPPPPPLPPLPARHEAPQLRAHRQHHLVQQTDTQVISGPFFFPITGFAPLQDELDISRLSAAGAAQAPAEENEGGDVEKNIKSRGRHEGILGIFPTEGLRVQLSSIVLTRLRQIAPDLDFAQGYLYCCVV